MPDNKYLRAIYAAAREHKVDSEGLHETALARFKCASLKDLTNAEACDLISGIRGITRKTWQKRQAMGTHGRRDTLLSPGEATYQPTPGELYALQQAARTRNWSAEALAAFAMKIIKKPAPQTQAEYNKLLWALKTMNRRDKCRVA